MYRGGTYLALGDSLNSVLQSNTNNTENDLFPTQVGLWIHTNKGNIQVLNQGVTGANTNDLIDYKWSWGAIRADLVTLQIGTNDSNAAGSMTTSKFQANLNTAIARLRVMNPTVRIVLCGPPQTIDATRTANIASYRTAMQSVATSANTSTSPVTYCDMAALWTTSATDLKTYMPSFDIQSITSTSTTMTVNATAHGLSVGSQISIRGSAQSTYNLTYNSATNLPVVATATTNSFTVTGTGFSTAGDSTAGIVGISDCVHPNRTGYAAMAGAVQSIIASDSWLNNLGVVN